MAGFLPVEIYRVIIFSDTVCHIIPLFQQVCRVTAECTTLIQKPGRDHVTKYIGKTK